MDAGGLSDHGAALKSNSILKGYGMRKIETQIQSASLDRLVYHVDESTPDFLIQWFNEWLDPYVNSSDSIVANQYLQLGFTYLRVSIQQKTMMLQAPDFVQYPIRWVDDLYPALHVVTQHKYVPQSYGLNLDIPSMHDTAIVGENFERYPMFMTRSEKEPNTDHSGWFIASLSDEVDNSDEGKLRIMSLYEAVIQAPHLVSYLSMPESSQIVFEESLPVIMFRNQVLEAQTGSYVDIAISRQREAPHL